MCNRIRAVNLGVGTEGGTFESITHDAHKRPWVTPCPRRQYHIANVLAVLALAQGQTTVICKHVVKIIEFRG